MKPRFFNCWLLISLVALLSLALSDSTSRAGTYTETFSGPLNPDIWEVYTSGHGETVEVAGGELVIKVPAAPAGVNYYAGIRSKFNHGPGAFQEQVDYRLVTWPTANRAGAGLFAVNMNNLRTQIYEYSAGWHEYEAIQVTMTGGYNYLKLPGNSAGTLLLKRDSDLTAWGMYWSGSAWVDICHNTITWDGKFQLGITAGGGSNPDGKAVEVDFDNFKITGVNVPQVGGALPGTSLLLLE